jgi:ubiquinone/menaquinone biosynthesis C-methylase UbiE
MILDVGCGSDVKGDVGIDLFRETYEDALKAKPFKIKKILVCGDALNLPFRDKVFEKCVSNAVLEHVENPVKMIKEMIRVCNYIEVITPNALWIGKLFRAFRSGKYRPYKGHIYTWGLPEMENLFNHCRLKNIKIDYTGSDPHYHKDYWVYGILEKIFPKSFKHRRLIGVGYTQ